MVKLAKGAKAQGKSKKALPPKEVEDSEDEDMEESEDEMMEVPVKTPSKKAATPAKATPGKKTATPAKTAVTPGKKGATPAGAKNGKKAKKEESDDEEDCVTIEEDSEEEKPVAKKPPAKKPAAKKEESEDDEEEDDDDEDDDEEEEDESEEEKPAAKKPVGKKMAAKKPSKKESEDEEDEESMDVALVTKGKKAVPKKEESEEDDDDDEEDEEEEDDDDEDDDDEEEDEESVKDSGKRKKEMGINKAAPEKKKQKTEGSEGLSVFVANLNSAKDFDELKDSLREFFSKKSLPVQDVRIGISKKFGYVDFSSIEEVEKAIKLSGKKVLGFEVKIEKANSPAEKNKNAENKKERDARTLFVKNLPYSTGVEELQEIFDNAKDIRLPVAKDGSSKGIAYVEFNTEAEADTAIQDKQGTEVEGRSMFIDYTGEKSQNAGGRRGGLGGDCKVLVVNNLAYSATEDSLQEVFEKATSVKIPQNNQGRPKGFAFVEFSSVEEAKDALESLNNTEIEGRSIRIEFSQGGGSQGGGRGSTQSKTLFVRGLSEDTTEETLKEAFDGSVNARIVTDRDTGTSKGFGFVDFSTAEDAKAAKEAMEDGEIDGNKVTLDFAKPKGDGQRGGRGGFGGRGGGRGGFGGRGGGRGGFGGRGGGRGGFGGRGGGRGGFGGRGGGGFRGGNQGKKIKFDD